MTPAARQTTHQAFTTAQLVVVVGSTVVAALLVAVQFAQPNALSGVVSFDDGVYFGSSLLLWRGTLPYADFVFLHPPRTCHHSRTPCYRQPCHR